MFMKKLLISSKSFVSLLNTTNSSFFWGLDHFSQLLNTSVLIGLELVFLIPSLTLSKHLLSLSFQKNPDFLIFWAVVRILTDVWNLCQTVPQRASPFYDPQTTDQTTNLRHESDKLLYGSHRPLAPGWTVVKGAQCRWWWRHRSRSHWETAARQVSWV